MTQKRWKPKKCTYYYSLDDCFVPKKILSEEDELDKMWYKAFNVFQTKKEAQKVAKQIKGFLKNRISL